MRKRLIRTVFYEFPPRNNAAGAAKAGELRFARLFILAYLSFGSVSEFASSKILAEYQNPREPQVLPDYSESGLLGIMPTTPL